MRHGCAWLWLAAAVLTSSAQAAAWSVRVDAQSGLPQVTRGGARALTSTYAFWEKGWTWANLEPTFRIAGPFDYALGGSNRRLGFDLAGRIRRKSSQELVWEFEFDARAAATGVTGGGIAFAFDPAAIDAGLGEPQVLPGNRGWTWGGSRGSRIELRFEPPLAAVYRQRGAKPEIRAFFYKGEIPQGKRRYVATLSVSGDALIEPTDAERFGLDDTDAWRAGALDWNGSPVDLSFLNAQERPAGKRGFLRTRGSALEFADGTGARFWGTNLTAYTLFGTPKDAVKGHARRLSELGFNLVRLHHHDSDWVDPNIFGGKQSRGAHKLDEAMLEKIDWWIHCLKQEGIYVWLDLQVGRTLSASDQIEHFDEIREGGPVAELKGYSYVNASIQRAMKRFNQAYVNHFNAYTRLSYKDDAAIVAMLVTNENDVTHHYGNALIPSASPPKHGALYLAEAKAFAARSGLAPGKTWRAWEPGPAKLFLNDLEQKFGADMISHLRAGGVQVPIVNTSMWGENPLSSLPAQAYAGVVDAHVYGGARELEKDPFYAPTLVHWIAAAQVAGLPLSVSEWNVSPFPVPDRHSVPLYVAASGALQGWDALVQYAYSQGALIGAGLASNWQSYNDPAMMASLPAAALLYRRKDVQESKTTYAFAPTREQLFDQLISPANSVALRTAAERGKLVVVLPAARELPWLQRGEIPAGAKVFTDPRQSFADAASGEIVSDSGELRRSWQRGTYTIDSPRSQAVTGWIGGESVRLGDVTFSIKTRHATVAVQSLDDKPIRESGALLISLGARSEPKSAHASSFRTEPVLGEISIRARKGMALHARRSGDPAARGTPVPYSDGRYRIALDPSQASQWLVLR